MAANGHNDLELHFIELIRFLYSLIDIFVQDGWSLSLKWSAHVGLTASIEIFGSHDFQFDLLSDTCSASDEGFQIEIDDDETVIMKLQLNAQFKFCYLSPCSMCGTGILQTYCL